MLVSKDIPFEDWRTAIARTIEVYLLVEEDIPRAWALSARLMRASSSPMEVAFLNAQEVGYWLHTFSTKTVKQVAQLHLTKEI